MAGKVKEEGFEGFVTSSKAISLSIVSVCVWGFTLLFYKMAHVFTDVDYAVFCLFCSFVLSLVLGIMISKNVYSKTDNLRIVAILLNIFLIYTSSNGIQAGNAAFSKPAEENKEELKKTPEKFALFGLLDVRPWLPDATSKKKIQVLEEENRYLSNMVENYQATLKANDQTGIINSLTIQNENLAKENADLKSEIISLREKGESSKTEGELRSIIDSLQKRWNAYEQRVNEYVGIRGEWINKTNADREFASFAGLIKKRLPSFKFSEKYYDQLFFYDLSAPK